MFPKPSSYNIYFYITYVNLKHNVSAPKDLIIDYNVDHTSTHDVIHDTVVTNESVTADSNS